MKELTIRIPENKLSFVLELMNQLGIEVSEQTNITEQHKAEVRRRISTTEAGKMVPWEDARKHFIFKEKP